MPNSTSHFCDSSMREGADQAPESCAIFTASWPIEGQGAAASSSASTLAEFIGVTKVARIFQASFEEEGIADKLLAEIAQGMSFEPPVGVEE